MHWKAMAGLKKKQRKATKIALVGRTAPVPPLVVTIRRTGPRKLDGDNLASACKYIRDQIAEWIGVDDGSPLYTWYYEQSIGEYGVEVEIIKREEPASVPPTPRAIRSMS